MTHRQASISELKSQAYAVAWPEYKINTMTRDEDPYGPDRLRWYIQVMIDVGERDPQKVATAALDMLHQYEQMLHLQECINT